MNALYTRLQAHGSMTRGNPELIRLAKAIPCSVEHLFKVATEQREGSPMLLKSIDRELSRKRVQAPSTASPARKPANGSVRPVAGR